MKIATGQELIQLFEQIAPRKLAMEGDNVGWQIGNIERQVNRILVALDVTEEVVAEAIALETNLIFAHHALLYRPLKQIITSQLQGRIVEKLIENKIGLFVAHTNLDAATGGVNDMLATALGLEKTSVLDPFYSDKKTGEIYGIGKLGDLTKSMTLQKLAEHVKATYQLQAVRVIGDLQQTIKKVAIVGGSGESYIAKAKAKAADCFISGDLSYHYAVDYKQEGICLIDAGHNIEKIMKEQVTEQLTALTTGKYALEVIASQVNTDPYVYL